MSEIPSNNEQGEQGQREIAFREAFTAAPAPVVTYALIAVNVAVFLAMLFTSSSFPSLTNPQMLRWGADFGPLTLNGQWWRMLTSCFLHFSFIHIGMNMFILYQAGVLTEKLFGNVRFLVLYVLAGLGGSVVSLFSHPLSVSAGASGAVFGVYGGLLGFLLVQRGVVPTRISLGIGRSAGVFLVYNLVWGLSSPGTDIQAHGGGLVSGLILGCALAAPILPTGQKLYPVRTLLVAAVGIAVIYAAVQRLPRPDADEGRWYSRISGSERLKVGKDSYVLYDGAAKKADAQALAAALTKEGFFTKTGELVLLHKGADGTSISILTNGADHGDADKAGRLAPQPWDDPQVLAWAQVTGVHVAPAVGGVPIQMEILSAQGKVMKVLPVNARELMVGADSIWYSGTSTPVDAEALGRVLTGMHFFSGRGARVWLDKGASGTSLSFVVRDGAWDDPQAVALLTRIAAGATPAIGGPPVTVYLMDGDFERKKTVVIQKQIASAKGLPMLPGQD